MLNVTGMNYSTLLRRSVDSDEYFKARSSGSTPTTRTSWSGPLLLSVMQLLWDRGEANGYAHHLTDDPLPNTPSHEVLLQVATGDHQVSNVTAEVEARTAGVPVYTPLAPGRHWEAEPVRGADADQLRRRPGVHPAHRLGARLLRRRPRQLLQQRGQPAGQPRVPKCTGKPVPGLGRDADRRSASAPGGRLRRGPARLPAPSGRRAPAHQGLPEAATRVRSFPARRRADPALLRERLERARNARDRRVAATLPRL